MIRAERWIQRELKLINPLYFAVFDGKKWRIRKWQSIHPLNHRIECWQINSKNIMSVPYGMLDRRAIDAVREGLWNALNAKKILLEIDRANDRQIYKAEIEDNLIARELAKSVWKHYREPSIFLNG